LRRAAELCQGWLPAKLGPDQIRQKRAVLDGYARAAGRDPAQAQAAFSAALYGYLAHAEETTTSR
jgi:alkanesulfonate monooxygenase SsuD/methylene tetrahydromethanopterin reductase-like flavin-dependent oxidoreductase (luciferase family)